ncbi:serine protease inhibitor [Streptomyces sp. NPDC058674]|uniref:serine protease inhibitor n=1 Tax=Streptomyces sp. NPDC058674 TaxID=3346592 RepID=UPI00364CD4B6
MCGSREDGNMTVEWPELVGRTADEAVAAIRSACPDAEVPVVAEGCMVTMDFREDRVRVFVDADGRVVRTPRVG